MTPLWLQRLSTTCRREPAALASSSPVGASVGQGPRLSKAGDERCLSDGGPADTPLGRPIVRPNSVHLGGVMAGDPLESRDREGRAVLLFLIAFPSPESKAEVAHCEVEVPLCVAASCGQPLAGESIFLAGCVVDQGEIRIDHFHSERSSAQLIGAGAA